MSGSASQPALAGSSKVLVPLKQFLGILPEDLPVSATELVGLDQFPLAVDSPLHKEHESINVFLPELVRASADYYHLILTNTEAGRAILASDAATRGRMLVAAAERVAHQHLSRDVNDPWRAYSAVFVLFREIHHSEPAPDRDGVFDTLLFLTAKTSGWEMISLDAVEQLVKRAATFAASSPFTPGELHVLYRLRSRAIRTPPLLLIPSKVEQLTRLLGDSAFFAIVPGEAWSDRVNADIGELAPASRQPWIELFKHATTATGSRPTLKWLKNAKAIVQTIGTGSFRESLVRWLPLVDAPRTVPVLCAGRLHDDDPNRILNDANATCLRGLLWLATEVASPELIRALGNVTVSCYRKIRGVGPRAVKVGNAGVYALSQINDPLAVGQLALLKVKVKFGSAQKEIEKAFTFAAERSGLPREELEEMSVPTYGLTSVGECEEKMGNFTARLTVVGTDSTELGWIKPDGKTQRGVPAEVKASHADDLKELQAAAKDIQKMLPAQRERIDSLFLRQKTWSFLIWRERYLDHPLVGVLARRLLWDFTTGKHTQTGIWFEKHLVDLDLKPVEGLGPHTTVRLWHPIDRSTEEIVAWRSWLDAQQIQQPFKQAHREIYVLTDAERNTRVYSNRYAAHVLRQHQFNALCALRDWKNKLRLMVDDEYPPASLNLPQWNLRAEFWIEGVGSDYGTDTNDSGVFLYLSTDQVRFYRVDAAQTSAHAGGGGYRPTSDDPLPLDQIPPLVFSEVMRDVDMFVGVASVGNDPTWADGGPQGRYRDYWQGVSFGELNATAKTRKDVLQCLIPKLKIASQCSFDEKFLVVKGSLRTYKIHLGSGNILMAPNDQYLCIVAKQSETKTGDIFLPFEGDRTLSVIISKAFLLAADSKITDSTILNQICGK